MGKRIKDISIAEQVGFVDTLRVLVDKLDADEGLPWLQAKSMQLKYLGNAYFAGSDNNSNFHPNIIESDSYIRFSTDGGNYWIDLSTKNVREDTNLYFTSQRVIDTHSSINHAGLTGILALGTTAGTALEGNTVIPSIVGLLNETSHDALDHTGLTGIHASGSDAETATSIAALHLTDIHITRGNYTYHDQSISTDTVGDWRQYADTNGFYTQYCTVANATKGAGTWVTKHTITI